MKPLKERLLGAVFRIGRYHAWWVLLFMLVLTGLAVYYARDVPLRSALFDLLPTNDSLIDEYRENEQYFAQSNFVGLLLTLSEDVPESEREAKLLRAAEVIAGELSSDPEFAEVKYMQDLSPEIPDQYVHLFELTQEELGQIEASIQLAREMVAGGSHIALLPGTTLGTAYAEISRGFTESLYGGDLHGGTQLTQAAIAAQLTDFAGLNEGILRTIERLPSIPDVTGAVRSLTELFAPTIGSAPRAPTALFSDDRTRLLMTAQPRYPSQRGVEYSTLVTQKVEAAIERADPEALGVRVGVTGAYPFNAQTNVVINADMLRTTIISSIGVFIIFLIAFGSFFYSIVAVVPLLISVVLTMCWAKMAVGGFNLVTTFLPALILGLGIDYAIHIISRYSEERGNGRSLNRALYAAVLHKGEASFYAAVTTALVFVGLLTARSRALFEMGAITSVGVLIAFFSTLFLLPALITLTHFLLPGRRRENLPAYSTRLTGFFHQVTGRGRAIFVIVLVLTFFVAFQAARTSFVFSSSDLVPRVESQGVMDEILASISLIPTGIGSYYTFFASTERELRTIVDSLPSHPLVEAVDSAAGLLPVDLTAQQQVLNSLDLEAYVRQLGALEASFEDRSAALAEIRTLIAQSGLLQYAASLNGQVDVALASSEVISQLRTIQGELGKLDVARTTEEIRGLQTALTDLDTNLQELRDLPPVEALLRNILNAYPEGIRTRYLTPEGDFIVQVRIGQDIFNADNLAEFNRFADSFADDYFGMPMVIERLEGYMKRDFYLSTLIAATLIILLLRVSLRGWVSALLAGAPLVLGYVWMLGGMRLLSMDFNFMSITISPLLIGIGVDNGIHIIHRTIEERCLKPEGAIERGVGTTAIPLIVTSLTTMLVFGSLLMARTPGLRVLGASALLGIGFALLFSLSFLPAALHVEGGKRV
jgi:predicted RND superfamily exporter protein